MYNDISPTEAHMKPFIKHLIKKLLPASHRVGAAAIALLLVASASMTALPAAAATESTADSYCGVRAATLSKNGETVSIEIGLSDSFVAEHKKQNVYLFALPYGTESLEGLSPITYFRATDRYIFKTPLEDGRLCGIYTGYRIAIIEQSVYVPVGDIKYITDFSAAALYDYRYPEVSSLKGLAVSGSLSDALALNLSHAVLEVDISALLATRGGADVTSFDFNGRTTRIVTSALAELDDAVRALSQQGVRVYLRLMPGDAYDSAAGLCRLLERRADELGGLIRLLAERYTDPDAPHGFAGSMIVGLEANLPAAEDGASMTADEYVSAYARLCRLAWAGLTSVYSEGRVYIAPSNNLSQVPEGHDTAATSLHDFLSMFNEITQRGGDYLWNVAASAYAYSLSDSSIWDDALATGASTQLISPANIEVLTSLIVKNYSLSGTRRRVIIGDFSAPDTDSESAQATSLAYAYYKIMENGGVEAIIWGTQCDSGDVGDSVTSAGTNATSATGATSTAGSRSRQGHGLSRCDLSGNILAHKQVWQVMQVLDTDCAGRLPALLEGIGLGGVVDYMYTTQSDAAQTKQLITGVGNAIMGREGLKVTPLLDFSRGDRCGVEIFGLGYAGSPALMSSGEGSALELTSSATLARYEISRSQLSGKHRIVISFAQCPAAGTLTLTLSQGDARRYIAEAHFERGSGDISFDVKAFCSDLDRGDVTLTLSLSPDNGEGIFTLSGISVAKVTTAAPITWIIIFVILVAAAVVVILLIFNGSFHAHRRSVARRARREGREDSE